MHHISDAVDFHFSAKKRVERFVRAVYSQLPQTFFFKHSFPKPPGQKQSKPSSTHEGEHSAQKSPFESLSPHLHHTHQFAMLPSHLNGHSPLARRRPYLAATAGEPPAVGAGATSAAVSLEEHDRIYFQSYSHIGIHEAMIKVSHRACDDIHNCII